MGTLVNFSRKKETHISHQKNFQKMPKIIIAFDNNRVTEQALRWYLSNSYREDHDVNLFHISNPPIFMAGVTEEAKNKEQEKWEKSESSLKQKAEDICKEFNVSKYNYYYTGTGTDHSNNSEQIAKQICDEIKRCKVDMIVMGCRNVRMKTYLGSVSDYII